MLTIRDIEQIESKDVNFFVSVPDNKITLFEILDAILFGFKFLHFNNTDFNESHFLINIPNSVLAFINIWPKNLIKYGFGSSEFFIFVRLFFISVGALNDKKSILISLHKEGLSQWQFLPVALLLEFPMVLGSFLQGQTLHHFLFLVLVRFSGLGFGPQLLLVRIAGEFQFFQLGQQLLQILFLLGLSFRLFPTFLGFHAGAKNSTFLGSDEGLEPPTENSVNVLVVMETVEFNFEWLDNKIGWVGSQLPIGVLPPTPDRIILVFVFALLLDAHQQFVLHVAFGDPQHIMHVHFG